MRFRFLPLKEMKTRGAASGSLLTGFPRAKLDSARRAWTVHRPSSCMVDQPPVAHRECVLKKSLQGQKQTHEKRRCFLNSTLQKKKKSATISLLSFINLCDMSNRWLPRAPSLHVSAMQHWGVEITPRSLRASQNWWVLMERSQAFRDVHTLPFGKNYVCFSECVPVWQTDGKITLSLGREAFLQLSSPRTQNTFLLHDTTHVCWSVIIGSPNTGLYHVLTLIRERDKKTMWLVQFKMKH